MRIYVASLADYNAGRLRGAWIDCGRKTEEELQEEVSAMLAESAEPVAEEWAIHDFEGFGSYQVGEYTSLKDIASMAEAIGQLTSEDEREAFWAFLANFSEEVDIDDFREAYQGTWDSVEDYAHDFLEDTDGLSGLSSHLRSYFDHDAYGRDLVLGGDIWTAAAKGGPRRVHVFQNL